MVDVLHVRALRDNYIWMVRAPACRQVAIVDPGAADPVIDFLERERLTPCAILCTHHHHDHTQGVAELVQRYAVPVYGPALEPIAHLSHPVTEGATVVLAELALTLHVWHVPGHTRGHIVYLSDDKAFTGDTLFSAGCGKLFEGTAEQLYRSLRRLAALPAHTQIFCGHEYTLANLRFAAAVEPRNNDIAHYRLAAEQQQQAGQPTLPSSVARERLVNPFLRINEPAVRGAIEARAGQTLSDDIAAFAALRRWKDDFRG